MKMSSLKELNVILLGETGTGKSLFINSFANYFHFQNLKEAVESKDAVTPILSKFKVSDSNYEDHEIISGDDDGNERSVVGKSFTIHCKSYKFQLGEVSVRLIDTPGVGDTEGEEADKANVRNILNFINYFENLHAIAILMKNTETKMTERFSECLKLLLTNLNKSALNNIVFILTFSKSNDFRPGPIKDVIKLFAENDLKESTLAINQNTMYCVDNKSYEYLISVQKNVQFNERDFDSQNINWEYSSQEIIRLMFYISGLTPHKVKDSACLNDARRFIKVLMDFLPKVLKVIDDNKQLLKDYEQKVQTQDDTIRNTEGDLTLRLINVKTIDVKKPITVCKSETCRKYIEFGGKISIHYPQICCNGCVVVNGLRWFCAEMNLFGGCKQCKCNIGEHEREFYKTELFTTDLLTDEARNRIKNATSAKDILSIKLGEIIKKKEQLINEQNAIECAEIKFAKFLKTNPITKPPVKNYNKENSVYSAENEVMRRYEAEIAQIKDVSIDEIYQLKEMLTKLPLNGNEINKIMQSNSKGLKSFIADMEVTRICKKTFVSLINAK